MKKLLPCTTIIILAGCTSSHSVRSLPAETTRTLVQGKYWKTKIEAKPALEAEKIYISQRRTAAGLPAKGALASGGAIGLALSGGGTRSATINLGVLQQLQEQGMLKNVDYLSCVSGGAYIGSWYVSHLTKKNPDGTHFYEPRAKGFQYTSNPDALLGTGDFAFGGTSPPVNMLWEKRGLVFGAQYIKVPYVLAKHIATLPVNAVIDIGLHLKPVRGKFNWHHPNYAYDASLRDIYFRKPSVVLPGQGDGGGFFPGNHEVRMEEVNPKGSTAPYLIVNCALANYQQGFPGTEALPFEFTRHSCGANALGYVPASSFGFPTEGTYKDGETRYTVQRASPLIMPSPVPDKFITEPFRVSSAVAASGAALDAGGDKKISQPQCVQKGTEINPPRVATKRVKGDLFLKPINLNLRHQNRNFAMAMQKKSVSGQPATIEDWQYPRDDFRDRFREMTSDRFHPTVFSNTLYLSDGAHYDNLGVFALTQRPEVREIWSIDATQDGKYEFDDLEHLKNILHYAGWSIRWDKGDEPGPGSLQFDETIKRGRFVTRPTIYKAILSHVGRKDIVLWYIKASYRQNFGRNEPEKAILKEYAGSTGDFPHVFTFHIAFKWNEFDAYRTVGRAMAYDFADVKKKRR